MIKKNILKYSALALLAFSFGSCTKDVDYDPASPQTNAQVFFSDDAATDYDLQEDQNSISIEVTRANTTGSVTVDLTSSAVVGDNETDIFNVPSSVTFADGENTATIPVTFDFNEIKPETDYILTVSLEGEALSLYGKTTQEVTVKYAPWSAWKQMSGEATLSLSVYWEGTFSYKIYTRNSLLNPDKVQYQIKDVLAKDTYTLTVDVDKSTNLVTVPIQSTDYVNTIYGEKVYVADVYTYKTQVRPNFGGDIPLETLQRMSYFDPETGVIHMNNIYFISLGSFSNGPELIQLPGYPDNNMYFAQKGTYIDEVGHEFNIVNLTKGSDVASYAVELVQGVLDNAEVATIAQQIVDDTNTTLYVDDKDFEFLMRESDDYTVVTVSYGSDGLPTQYNYYTFEYEMKNINNYGWKPVTTTCMFTDPFMVSLLEDLESPLQWEVEVQESEYTPGLYRIVKPYAAVADIYEEEAIYGPSYIEVDASDPENVNIPLQYNCFNLIIGAVANGKLADNKITMPANSCGTFFFYTDGNLYTYGLWPEECVVLDLNYVEPEEAETPDPATSTRSASHRMKMDVKKTTARPYKGGRKLTLPEKKLTTALSLK